MEKITSRLLNWASILEPSTREQAVATSTMPFIFPHLALMPDAHLGKGATVGSVIPTQRAIMPAAVGVDIGCGMIAVRTQFVRADLTGRPLSELRVAIEGAIPAVGRQVQRQHQCDGLPTHCRTGERRVRAGQIRGQLAAAARNAGLGNHFIEVTVDETDAIWLFLHSGSRGVGNKIAQHHITVARKLMEQYWISLPDPDLAYLVEGTDQFGAYIRDLNWAQKFALANREEMMDRVLACFAAWLGAAVREQERINCHHNFTQREKHFGRDVWVSRKGAIEARAGQAG